MVSCEIGLNSIIFYHELSIGIIKNTLSGFESLLGFESALLLFRDLNSLEVLEHDACAQFRASVVQIRIYTSNIQAQQKIKAQRFESTLEMI